MSWAQRDQSPKTATVKEQARGTKTFEVAATRLSIDELVERAQAAIPSFSIRTISIPKSNDKPVKISGQANA